MSSEFDVLGATITSTEGLSTSGAIIGSFTTTLAIATTSMYSGTVVWGDGSSDSLTSSNFAVTNNNATNSSVVISADHLYEEAGTYAITITVTETYTPEETFTTVGTISSQAVIADAELQPGFQTPFSVPVNTSFANVLASFFDTNPYAPDVIVKSEFSALIDWGDSTGLSIGTLTKLVGPVPPAPTNFNVSGTHTYSRPGIYNVKILVNDDDGKLVNLSNTITVTAAPNSIGPLDIEVFDFVAKKKHCFNYIANFFDESNSNMPGTYYNAVIQWGDCSSSTVATVTQVGTGTSQYNITAEHKYKKSGKYNVLLNLNGVLSSSVVEVLCKKDHD